MYVYEEERQVIIYIGFFGNTEIWCKAITEKGFIFLNIYIIDPKSTNLH